MKEAKIHVITIMNIKSLFHKNKESEINATILHTMLLCCNTSYIEINTIIISYIAEKI